MMYSTQWEITMIRRATIDDISRIAEILVFVKRMNYRPIFQNDDYSFGELQVFTVAKKYKKPDILKNILVCWREYNGKKSNCR